jgi:hypothetical protein
LRSFFDVTYQFLINKLVIIFGEIFLKIIRPLFLKQPFEINNSDNTGIDCSDDVATIGVVPSLDGISNTNSFYIRNCSIRSFRSCKSCILPAGTADNKHCRHASRGSVYTSRDVVRYRAFPNRVCPARTRMLQKVRIARILLR